MEAIKGAEGNVNAVDDARRERRHQRKTASNRNQRNHNQGNSNQGNQKAKKKYFKCGISRHGKQETCPAKNKICDYCNGRSTLPRYASRNEIKKQLSWRI